MWGNEISFIFMWESTRFSFYLYGSRRDFHLFYTAVREIFFFIFTGVNGISFLLIRELRFSFLFILNQWDFLFIYNMEVKNMGCPRGVMVKAMNCGIVVREFVLQSRYYVHFRANTPWERYEPPYSPSSYG